MHNQQKTHFSSAQLNELNLLKASVCPQVILINAWKNELYLFILTKTKKKSPDKFSQCLKIQVCMKLCMTWEANYPTPYSGWLQECIADWLNQSLPSFCVCLCVFLFFFKAVYWNFISQTKWFASLTIQPSK